MHVVFHLVTTGCHMAMPTAMRKAFSATTSYQYALSQGNDTTTPTIDVSSNCRDLHNSTILDICAFVSTVDDCQIDEGLVNYLEVTYCHFASAPALGFVILFFWWLFLFIGLAVAAEQFFVPALTVMAKTLRLSDSIAGVTFLAFGNGAPDIFSAIAAISNSKNGDNSLAFGALLGAGVFVTTAIAGCVILAKPFKCMERPLLRDIIFYMVAVFGTFYVTYYRRIYMIEAIGFIALYVAYVLTVVIGGAIYRRRKLRAIAAGLLVTRDGEDADVLCPNSAARVPCLASFQASPSGSSVAENLAGERRSLLGNERKESYSDALSSFMRAINPITKDDWNAQHKFGKILLVAKAPTKFVLTMTVPVVDRNVVRDNWNRWLNSLQCILGPVIGIFIVNLWDVQLGNGFAAWHLVLIISTVLAILVWFTTTDQTPPKAHAAFAFFGFAVAIIWIYSMANEIINLLQMYGVAFNISDAILGLTLLAWGNSLSDGIANTATAMQGFPRMGLAACFGGQYFNLVLGIGIPFTILTIKNDGFVELTPLDFKLLVLLGFLLISLIVTLIFVPLVLRFQLTRRYAIFLIVVYVVFLTVALLSETNVIQVSL